MKSSMRNPCNFPSLRADKRFEALVKQEMSEHEHIISSHHKEMQDLRDLIRLSMEKFQSLFEHSQSELKDFKTCALFTIGTLQEKIRDNQIVIEVQKKALEIMHNKMLDMRVEFTSKIDAEKFKKVVENQIKDSTERNINSFQDLQRELVMLFNNLKDVVLTLRSDMDEKIDELTKKTETNLHLSMMNKEGITKEIRVYDKTIFIIEKKLENIYTLIERINKRGESCPRQE